MHGTGLSGNRNVPWLFALLAQVPVVGDEFSCVATHAYSVPRADVDVTPMFASEALARHRLRAA